MNSSAYIWYKGLNHSATPFKKNPTMALKGCSRGFMVEDKLGTSSKLLIQFLDVSSHSSETEKTGVTPRKTSTSRLDSSRWKRIRKITYKIYLGWNLECKSEGKFPYSPLFRKMPPNENEIHENKKTWTHHFQGGRRHGLFDGRKSVHAMVKGDSEKKGSTRDLHDENYGNTKEKK